ncbi:MAG TPA: collagen-binding domain-containing protein [Chthoniobacterales bacterium]|nr:collagen-binding domain-containing protein [Chthoniobacterales bacterium]
MIGLLKPILMTLINKYIGAMAVAGLMAVGFGGPLQASIVDLGAAGQFGALALTTGIDDSGPLGPDGSVTINADVGVASSGQSFSASGSVVYSGNLYLHTGVTYNNSAPGVPLPQPQNATNDAFLAQARSDAFAASNFALTLGVTATYGTINTNTTISEGAVGNYVFSLQGGINFSGNSTLTLSAPAGSCYVLNISNQFVLTGGSVLLSGGLTADNVLLNYTGTSDVRFSGGGNSSQVYGTILAPNAKVDLSPGLVVGRVIASGLSMSSGAQILTPVPEVTPGSVIFGFLGLVIAVGSRKALAARLIRVRAKQ